MMVKLIFSIITIFNHMILQKSF